MILRTELATRVFDTPLFMHAGKAQAALCAIGERLVEGGITIEADAETVEHVAFEGGRPSLGRIGDGLGRMFERAGVRPYDMVDNVAIIAVEGTLVHKGGYVGASSGRTSYQGIQTQVQRARKDEAVKGVVFEVDSFGGEAAGAFETADMIGQLSAEKPTLAILTDFGMSAGYLMASAARQIVMPPTGGVGSIGAVVLHADVSRKLKKEGVRVTILTAGAHKADGNPLQSLPAEVAERITAELEAGRQAFAASVGRYRGERFTAEAALATEARSYRGTDAAAIGMVDALGSGAEAFDLFLAELKPKGKGK